MNRACLACVRCTIMNMFVSAPTNFRMLLWCTIAHTDFVKAEDVEALKQKALERYSKGKEKIASEFNYAREDQPNRSRKRKADAVSPADSKISKVSADAVASPAMHPSHVTFTMIHINVVEQYLHFVVCLDCCLQADSSNIPFCLKDYETKMQSQITKVQFRDSKGEVEEWLIPNKIGPSTRYPTKNNEVVEMWKTESSEGDEPIAVCTLCMHATSKDSSDGTGIEKDKGFTPKVCVVTHYSWITTPVLIIATSHFTFEFVFYHSLLAKSVIIFINLQHWISTSHLPWAFLRAVCIAQDYNSIRAFTKAVREHNSRKKHTVPFAMWDLVSHACFACAESCTASQHSVHCTGKCSKPTMLQKRLGNRAIWTNGVSSGFVWPHHSCVFVVVVVFVSSECLHADHGNTGFLKQTRSQVSVGISHDSDMAVGIETLH